jgi:hypothetical protein
MNSLLITKLIGKMSHFGAKLKPGFRLIRDKERKLGNFSASVSGIRVNLNKEEVTRRHVLERPGEDMSFLDVGARDGELTYLLGIRGNFDYDESFYKSNRERFQAKYKYF